MTKTTALLASLIIAGLASSADAATLAFYDIESILTQADSANATGITASAIDATSADGTSANYSWEGSGVPYWFVDNVNDGTDPGVADILATFSLTPDAGQQIELGTTDVFDIGVLALQADPNDGYEATARVIVASDSGFNNILATSTTLLDTGLNSTEPTLGSLDLDNPVISASTLHFGVAMVDNLPSHEEFNARFDGLQVNGAVIPEPTSAILALCGLVSFGLIGRRRKS